MSNNFKIINVQIEKVQFFIRNNFFYNMSNLYCKFTSKKNFLQCFFFSIYFAVSFYELYTPNNSISWITINCLILQQRGQKVFTKNMMYITKEFLSDLTYYICYCSDRIQNCTFNKYFNFGWKIQKWLIKDIFNVYVKFCF